MSELQRIEQSEKYPDETTSFILGNCYDEKETAEIVHRCDCYNELKAKADCHDDLVEALKAEQKARSYIGSWDVARKLFNKAADLREAALAKVNEVVK